MQADLELLEYYKELFDKVYNIKMVMCYTSSGLQFFIKFPEEPGIHVPIIPYILYNDLIKHALCECLNYLEKKYDEFQRDDE